MVSGADRVDESRLAEVVGDEVERATADFVRARTGFAIGGVPPVGHSEAVATYIDEHLLGHDLVWAAAGTPNAVFSIKPADLARVTSATIVAVAAG
jgi:prolyl-tRNA editing enzyme YbaK/EbsC (Cys-tRNA(Pro) deacylase)